MDSGLLGTGCIGVVVKALVHAKSTGEDAYGVVPVGVQWVIHV